MNRVTRAIIQKFASEVRWPTRLESRRTEQSFFNRSVLTMNTLAGIIISFNYGDNCRFGIHGVRGAMDGTHVRIRTPSADASRAYYDKDGNHSIILHIVCNDE